MFGLTSRRQLGTQIRNLKRTISDQKTALAIANHDIDQMRNSREATLIASLDQLTIWGAQIDLKGDEVAHQREEITRERDEAVRERDDAMTLLHNRFRDEVAAAPAEQAADTSTIDAAAAIDEKTLQLSILNDLGPIPDYSPLNSFTGEWASVTGPARAQLEARLAETHVQRRGGIRTAA